MARKSIFLFVIFCFLASCNPQTTTPATPVKTTTPLPTNDPAAPVEVWLTLPDESKKLSREPGLGFSAARAHAAYVIQIDETTLYQQMEGFGAAMTDSSAFLLMRTLNEQQRAEVMAKLFSRQGEGIGLSFVRVPLGASDFALHDYSYDDLPAGETDPGLEHFSVNYDEAYIIPALKLAQSLNAQLRFLGSPWSAPGWMKAGGKFHGSALLPEFYAAFADYHVRFVQAYAEAGVTIDAITPQNEPMFATDGYPTMLMPAEAQKTFVRDFLGPAFQQAGLATRIVIFDHNWDLWQYPLDVLADPQAAAFVDGVAFHCYGGSVASQSLVHNAHPDKGIWFTECSGGGWSEGFAKNLSWNMRNLVIGNFRNWGNSVMLWNLALDENAGPQNGGCSNCRGVVTINQTTGEVTYNEEFYILGHLSKFVDPGAYRAESTAFGEGQPENVAFLNPDGSLVLLVHATRKLSFTVEWQGKQFAYELPAGAVVTFKWAANAAISPTVTPAAISTQRATQTPPGLAVEPPPSGVLLNFEGGNLHYDVYNAGASLAQPAHSGASALRSHSVGGEWHTVGSRLGDRPVNLTGRDKICFWVYDTVGGENTVGVRLFDARGNHEERWSDHAEAGYNPPTTQDEWVQMCLNLSAYSLVELTMIDRIEFAMYWAGDYYFDDVTVR